MRLWLAENSDKVSAAAGGLIGAGAVLQGVRMGTSPVDILVGAGGLATLSFAVLFMALSLSSCRGPRQGETA